MSEKRFQVGVSAAWMHADPGRRVFDGRSLLFVEHSMAEWLLAEPAMIPLMVPWPRPEQPVEASAEVFADVLDGLVLQGGADMAPQSYGQEPLRQEWSGDPDRDEYELALVKAFVHRGKPVLGICRGHQVLNVAFGGTLYQDIQTQVQGSLAHRDGDVYHDNTHGVVFVEGSTLAEIYGVGWGLINSVHHQAVKDLAPGMVVEAWSPEDDVVEAIRWEGDSFVMGVQWHPEFQEPRQSDLLPTEPLRDLFLTALRNRGPG